MRAPTITLVVAAIALVASRPAPAAACSLAGTYLPPTNYELVADSPRIVVAMAVEEASADKSDRPRVVMEVETVLRGKGIAKGDRITVRGSTADYRGAGAKNDFSQARPGSYTGGCTAWDYKTGKHYLLLLQQYDGHWDTRGEPFARVNEEVDAKGDAWVTAVKEYVRIAGLAAADRRKAFDALVARGATKGATAADKAIATDVATHLAAPTPYKSFAELEPMFTAATGPDRDRVLLAIGAGTDAAARAFMKGIVDDLRAGKATVDADLALESVAAYYEKVADRDALTALADYYVKLGTKKKQERWGLMWLLIHHADASHQAVMERALAGADDEEAGRLATWFAAHPSAAVIAAYKKKVNGKYAERYDMALGLAGMGDTDVVAWAKGVIAGKASDHRWIALYAIAASPTKAADAVAGTIIKRGGDDLVGLIQGYKDAHHARADVRLEEIGAKRGLSKEAAEWLGRTRQDRQTSSTP